MSGGVKELVVKLIADAKEYDKGTKKAVKDNEEVKKSSGGLKEGFIKGAGAALGFIGTAVGIASVGDAIGMVTDYIHGAIDGAMEMQTAQAETNRILSSGSHVIGLTGDMVDKMSESLMAQTGVDDDVVRGAENILAGYNNISLQAYPSVTKAALDMARAQQQAAGQQFDAAAASRALGMALQDPAKGARLLRQYNIVLSQSQQDAINTAMKHGDVQKAQGIIMDAVTAKVNGASEAYKNTAAGGMMAFQTAMGNIQKDVGTALLPILTQLLQIVTPIATQLAQHLPDALDGVSKSFGPVVKGVVDFTKGLLDNKPLMEGIQNAFKQLQPLIGPVALALGIMAAIGFAPLALLVGIIIGIVLGLKKLWEITEPLRTAIGNLMGKLGELRDKVLVALQPAIHNVSSKLAELHTWFNDKVLPIIKQVHAFFQDKILPVLEKVGGFIRDQVVAQLQRMWSFIQANVLPILGQLGGLIKDGIGNDFQMFGNTLNFVFGHLGDVFGAMGRLKDRAGDLMGKIGEVKDKFGDFLGKLGQIKDSFNNLHLEFPKIKMPHFSITGSFSLNPPSVPHLDIQWYKTGGIFTGPQVIGVGEAGPEAVIPLDRLSSAGGGGNGGEQAPQRIEMIIDGRRIAEAILPHIVNSIRTNAAIRSI